jgi:hypothetical protein
VRASSLSLCARCARGAAAEACCVQRLACGCLVRAGHQRLYLEFRSSSILGCDSPDGCAELPVRPSLCLPPLFRLALHSFCSHIIFHNKTKNIFFSFERFEYYFKC